MYIRILRKSVKSSSFPVLWIVFYVLLDSEKFEIVSDDPVIESGLPFEMRETVPVTPFFDIALVMIDDR
jgi:hypothetical protein